jgi:hypothetical protein
MKSWKDPECKIRIKGPDKGLQLHLKIEKTLEGIDRKAFGLEFVERATEIFSELLKMFERFRKVA